MASPIDTLFAHGPRCEQPDCFEPRAQLVKGVGGAASYCRFHLAHNRASGATPLRGRVAPAAVAVPPQIAYLRGKASRGESIRFDRARVRSETVLQDTLPSDYDHTAFLGNFDFSCPMIVGGHRFECPEALYQAAKFGVGSIPIFTARVSGAKERAPDDPNSAGELAWREGQRGRATHTHPCRTDFDQVRVRVMAHILLAHYKQHPKLAALLLETREAPLVEWSHHGDLFWGKDATGRKGVIGAGENQLGRLHMAIRSWIQKGGRLESLRDQSLNGMLMFGTTGTHQEAEAAVAAAIQELSSPRQLPRIAPTSAAPPRLSPRPRIVAGAIPARDHPSAPPIARVGDETAPLLSGANRPSYLSSFGSWLFSIFQAIGRLFSRLWNPPRIQQ